MSYGPAAVPQRALTPGELVGLRTALAHFDARTRSRGEAYADQLVDDVTADDGVVRARVHGTAASDVIRARADRVGTPACTCPVGSWGKHAYATAVVAIRAAARVAVLPFPVSRQRKAALVRDVPGEGGFGRALTGEDLDDLIHGDPEDA